MKDLIRRSDVKEYFKRVIFGADQKIDAWVDSIPAVDAVGRAVYEQVVWERDIAVKQLADIGKSLGEKMDDVAKVVRCRECKYYDTEDGDLKCVKEAEWDEDAAMYSGLVMYHLEDYYCADGQRREDGEA